MYYFSVVKHNNFTKLARNTFKLLFFLKKTPTITSHAHKILLYAIELSQFYFI